MMMVLRMKSVYLYRIKQDICAEKFVYHAKKFAYTVALGTPMRLPLITFLSIIGLEGRIIFTDCEDGLIQGFAQIP